MTVLELRSKTHSRRSLVLAQGRGTRSQTRKLLEVVQVRMCPSSNLDGWAEGPKSIRCIQRSSCGDESWFQKLWLLWSCLMEVEVQERSKCHSRLDEGA